MHIRVPLEADRNISGLVVERYELLPRWREDTDNSPQIHPKMGTEIGCFPDEDFNYLDIY